MSIVNGGLLAAVVLSLLLLARDTVSLVLSDASGDSAIESAEEQPARKPRKELLEYKPLLKNNVFGFPSAELVSIASQGEAAPQEVPQTVDIKLMGAVAWPGGYGFAFVDEGGSGGQEVYKTGDTIKGAGRLVRVESYGIVLESGGREVKVPLEEVSEPVASVPRKPLNRRQRDKGQPPAAESKSNGFARQTAKNEFVVDRKAIDESLENPRNVLTDARLLPRMVDGDQEGFVMSEVRSGGLYDSIGLKNGDVLLSVNDFKLSNPQAALQAFSALKGMDRIKLDILRGGDKMTLTYSIR